MSLSDKEKIRVLEKKVHRLEQLLGKGAMAQYLFCPSLNCWLPSQCDEQGRQVIDPSDLDTRYLKLDGSGKMLDDIKFALGKGIALDDEWDDYSRVVWNEPIWGFDLQDYSGDLGSASVACYDVHLMNDWYIYKTILQTKLKQTTSAQWIISGYTGTGWAGFIEFISGTVGTFKTRFGMPVEMNSLVNIINGILRLPDTRPATPQAGDTRYDAGTDTFEIYDGAVWRAH